MMKVQGSVKDYRPVTADKATVAQLVVTLPFVALRQLIEYRIGDAIEIELGHPVQRSFDDEPEAPAGDGLQPEVPLVSVCALAMDDAGAFLFESDPEPVLKFRPQDDAGAASAKLSELATMLLAGHPAGSRLRMVIAVAEPIEVEEPPCLGLAETDVGLAQERTGEDAFQLGVAAWGRDRHRKHPKEECPYEAGTHEAGRWQDGYESAAQSQQASDLSGEASFEVHRDSEGHGLTCEADRCRKRKLAACPKCGSLRCEEHYSEHLLNAHGEQLQVEEGAA